MAETAKKQRGTPFAKGKSGNPNGRPRKTPEIVEIELLAKLHSPEALERLAYWMRSGDAAASVKASTTIIERGWGKAKQTIDATITERYVIRAPVQPETADDWRSVHGPH